MAKLFAIATLLAVVLTAPQSRRSDLIVDDLRCEYATDPMGIDVAAPRLFWKMASDIGGAAVFLASGASDYVNGHVLAVDGGWLAR